MWYYECAPAKRLRHFQLQEKRTQKGRRFSRDSKDVIYDLVKVIAEWPHVVTALPTRKPPNGPSRLSWARLGSLTRVQQGVSAWSRQSIVQDVCRLLRPW